MRNLFFTIFMPLVLFTSCGSDVEYVGLSDPAYFRKGINVVAWKKVLRPEISLRPVGYVQVMEYRLDEKSAMTYFEVMDKYYLPLGNISAHGKVRKYATDEFTKEPIIKIYISIVFHI